MNKQQLQQAIAFLFEPESILGLELYFVLNGFNGIFIRRADLGDGQLPKEVLRGFIDHLRNRTNINDDAVVKPLSELDPSRHTIHHYNLKGLPDGLDVLNIPLNSEATPFFNFDKDKLDNLVAFLIRISSVDQQIILYKKHSHLNVLKQKRIIYLIKDDERFVKPDEDILRFSFTIDFLKVDNEIMVYEINTLEKEFKFFDIIKNNAQLKVVEIAGLDFVENIEELDDLAQDKSGAKKILSLKADSPVLQLPFETIKTFVKNHDYLKKRLRFNATESRFYFHSKVARLYFIELLNDNFLTSDLTSILYKTHAKDIMTDEDAEESSEA